MTDKLPDTLVNAATKYSTEPALISGETVLTYRENQQAVSDTTTRLAKTGIDPGDRIAIISKNCLEYPILLNSLWRLGAVACLFNPAFPAGYLSAFLDIVDSRYIIVSDKDYDGCIDNPAVIHITDIVNIGNISKPDIPDNKVYIEPDKPATIILTSGSSSEPKAVLHSYGNHFYSAAGSNENIPFSSGDRWLLSLPLYHVGGLSILFRAMLGGGAVVIPEEKMNISEAVTKYQPTHLSLVSTQLRRLLDNLSAGYNNLKVVLVGGGAVDLQLSVRAIEHGLPLYLTYGLTEMASQVTTTDILKSSNQISSGRLLSHREMMLSTDGEILVKGATFFQGYIKKHSLTCPVDEKGWFLTGDLGYLDEEGNLHVTGRKDNQFISGGENIQPEEIERLLYQLYNFSEVMVVPVSDDEYGFRPVAFIRGDFEPKTLQSELRNHLPPYKIPDTIHSWPEETIFSAIKPNRQQLSRLASELKDQ